MPASGPRPHTLWVDAEAGLAGCGSRVFPLSPQEFAVLVTLVEAGGRVVSRTELARRAGMQASSRRRPDSVLVALRQVLGADAVRNIRNRGWTLDPDAIEPA